MLNVAPATKSCGADGDGARDVGFEPTLLLPTLAACLERHHNRSRWRAAAELAEAACRCVARRLLLLRRREQDEVGRSPSDAVSPATWRGELLCHRAGGATASPQRTLDEALKRSGGVRCRGTGGRGGGGLLCAALA